MAVAVVADSASNLPRELRDEYRITVVPQVLHVGGRTLRDGVDVTADEFYALLVTHRGAVTTAAPMPGDYAAAFEECARWADEIVCVTVAANLSGTFQNAALAAQQQTKPRVFVLDSGQASMGEGFVALEAARAASEQADLQECVDRAMYVAGRTRLVAMIDTLEQLRRSGRVSFVAAMAGSALRLRPVFELRDGRPRKLALTRTKPQAIDRVVREIGRDAAPLHLAVFHAAAPGEGRLLLDAVARTRPCAEAYLVEFTPVMGAHTGPGVVGAVYWS